MKFIVSTKHFAQVLRQAISIRCEFFVFIPDNKEFVFNDSQDLCLSIVTQKFNGKFEEFTFNPIQMFKVSNFLDELEEQPIVVELCQYEENKLSIELSQFIKRF